MPRGKGIYRDEPRTKLDESRRKAKADGNGDSTEDTNHSRRRELPRSAGTADLTGRHEGRHGRCSSSISEASACGRPSSGACGRRAASKAFAASSKKALLVWTTF